MNKQYIRILYSPVKYNRKYPYSYRVIPSNISLLIGAYNLEQKIL